MFKRASKWTTNILSNRIIRHMVLLALDFFCLAFSCVLIFGVYPSAATRLSSEIIFKASAVLCISLLAIRFLMKIYSQSWRYASEAVYFRIIIADTIGGLVFLLINFTLIEKQITVIHTVAVVTMELILTLGSRFIYHIVRSRGHLHSKKSGQDGRSKMNVAIVGASDMGVLLVKELMVSKTTQYVPVCFFDNNNLKIGNYIMDLKVYAENETVSSVADRMMVDAFVIAIPNKDAQYIKNLYSFYQRTGRKVMIYDFPLNQPIFENTQRTIRDLKIEDLLTRAPIDFSGSGEAAFYKSKTILVSGAGGSIGSELCRQLVHMNPKCIVLLDIYENSVYDLQQELKNKTEVCVEIASVREEKKLDLIFEKYKPTYVFHAAAHKHVPLMEHNPDEAIKNNVFGTLNMVNVSEKHKVQRFVMISTDKAVNPTNIMGASKRICEMIIQSRKNSETDFVAVRFGNVLNSNGSVIPLFKKQIEDKGPVTITDKRIIRYFMMIPEAAQLVLQTGCRAEKGDLYILDMGKPVKILDLAENMIRLSGYEPYVDIDIVEIGLRPGEKLYEELLIRDETSTKTENERIYIERDEGLSREKIEECMDTLRKGLESNDEDLLRDCIRQVVPSYCNPDEVNEKAMDAKEMMTASPNNQKGERV